MFLTSIFAATPENPRFSLNDPAAWDALGAQPAASGVRVNRQTALTYSPYYRAISLISGAFAKLPVVTYRTVGSGKVVAPEHPAYRLLRWKPNSEQTAVAWKRQMQVQALTEGNAYSYIKRDQSNGAPVELWPLDPVKTFPVRENGRLWYVTEVPQSGDRPAEKRKLPAEDVLHFAGLSYDGVSGLSITECAREALGWGMGGQRYGSVFFKNNGRPSVVLQHPLRLDKKAKDELREGWERMHTGLDNAHRTAILDAGLTIKELSLNAQQAQLIEQLKQNGIDIANFFDLPPHKLGNRDATSYASLEQENQAFLDDCLDIRLIQAEEQFRDKLLTEEEKDAESHAVLFDRRKLIQANMQTRSAYYRTALGGQPWMTTNEVREEEGMNPSDDADADELPKPLNMGQGGGQNQPKKPGKSSVDEGGDGENARTAAATAAATDARYAAVLTAQRPLVEDAVHRMVGRAIHHGGQLDRAARGGASAYMAWVERIGEEHGQVFAAALDPVDEAVQALRPGAPVGLSGWLLTRLQQEFAALADAVTVKALPAEARRRAEELQEELAVEAADLFLGKP